VVWNKQECRNKIKFNHTAFVKVEESRNNQLLAADVLSVFCQ